MSKAATDTTGKQQVTIDIDQGHRQPQHKTPHQPNERDESPDPQPTPAHTEMKQAHADLESGQVDTDLRGERGVEKAVLTGGVPKQ